MLPYTLTKQNGLPVLLLHFLGGSQLEWLEVTERLAGTFRCITVDLPGFGDAAHISGYSVAEMADSVTELVAYLNLDAYVLAGHSMAGKVCMAITRRLLSDEVGPNPPAGLILVAPSPPSPEPIKDEKRMDMLNSFGVRRQRPDADEREQAMRYIQDNLARPLPNDKLQRTIDELLRMNPAAWTAWLEEGSREDWSHRVGVLDIPSLLLSGRDDKGLGPEVQTELTLPHLAQAQHVVLACSHLIPLEMPEQAAQHISLFLENLGCTQPLQGSNHA
jgi:pimeloyl-ACP methyl ester carboxylesterase